MTRTQQLRERLGWSQRQLADHLGTSQPTVARLEAGQPESGPVSKLLDQLERDPAPRVELEEAHRDIADANLAEPDAPVTFTEEETVS